MFRKVLIYFIFHRLVETGQRGISSGLAASIAERLPQHSSILLFFSILLQPGA